MEAMRVLRVYPFLPPLPGGMEKHILRLTEEQRILGCEVTLAFNRGAATNENDIAVLSLWNLRRVKPQAIRDFIFYMALMVQVIARGCRFDVVHIHGDWSAFLFGRLLKKLAGASKLVGSIHGVSLRGFMQNLYRFALSGYSIVYATGAQDAGHLSAITGREIFWQHSGIDPVFVKTEPEVSRTYEVISVGSFVPVKNHALILEIASRLPGYRFLLIGDGPLRGKLETECHDRSIANITFHGQLPADRVAAHLRTAKIFLLTSLAEGTPTALLEAMACGLAVVISHSNDYINIINDSLNGYVIDGFKPDIYVEIIQKIIEDDSGLNEISDRNARRAISFAWPEVAQRITEWMRAC